MKTSSTVPSSNPTSLWRVRRPYTTRTLVLAALVLGSVLACANKKTESQSDTRYQVRVAVKELQGRKIEGTVRQHTLYADQPKVFGADDTAPTPPETLAFALGSCVVSTGRLLAMHRKLAVRNLSAVVEGELDFAHALGVNTQKRAGFSGLSVSVYIDADLSEKGKVAFLREVSARCPMCDNLANATHVSVNAASL
jgi:uncharacterized OsmC-like protein